MVRVVATELMPDFTGRLLDRGRITVLENLGAGAYGKVYRALRTTVPAGQENVAIKCLNKPQPGSHTDLLQQREFALHKLVSGHPNIVTFHEYFTDPLYVYVVLDLCDGGDLFSAITEKHIFHKNSMLIKNAFLQLIDAVQYCHDLGVFHRDIKPENILCSGDGKVIRLADFGLSIKSSVCHDFGCGSSYYMSPECIGEEITSGKYSTRHNDIWALGVILTNMITGRNPWRYATSDDPCFSAYLHNNDFLRQVLPISDGVNTILKCIFAINPLRRITLPDLRMQIVDLHTFYTDKKDPAAKSTVRRVVKTKTLSIAPAKVLSADPRATLITSDSSSRASADSEDYIFSSPPDDLASTSDLNVDQFLNVPRFSHPDAFAIGGSDCSSSAPSYGSSGLSGEESKGPNTPSTRTVEPSIEVPDILAEAELGQPTFDLTAAAIASRLDEVCLVKEKKSTAQLIRTAVQRLKGFSATRTPS